MNRELENSRYIIGAGAEYTQIREAALERRGAKGILVSGGEPDLYHIIYDTSISGRERCARAQSEDSISLRTMSFRWSFPQKTIPTC